MTPEFLLDARQPPQEVIHLAAEVLMLQTGDILLLTGELAAI